mmetsp:Transcript_8180/g.10686  ORF Transcript_8180/g.10686 Transcript_8180/m.10686 type:complete len:131 (-) Transcript_8180:384-776(-)
MKNGNNEQWEQRRMIYGIYETEDEVRAAVEQYGVVTMPVPKENDEDCMRSSASSHPALSTTPRNSSSGGRDIWGRFPGKEPKELIPCPVCSRSVNTGRFAPHLDKCMGIGNMTRAAAVVANNLNTNGTSM